MTSRRVPSGYSLRPRPSLGRCPSCRAWAVRLLPAEPVKRARRKLAALGPFFAAPSALAWLAWWLDWASSISCGRCAARRAGTRIGSSACGRARRASTARCPSPRHGRKWATAISRRRSAWCSSCSPPGPRPAALPGRGRAADGLRQRVPGAARARTDAAGRAALAGGAHRDPLDAPHVRPRRRGRGRLDHDPDFCGLAPLRRGDRRSCLSSSSRSASPTSRSACRLRSLRRITPARRCSSPRSSC